MIRKYQSDNFKILKSWVTDKEILLQFSGTDFSFPITQEQINLYQATNSDRTFYLGLGDNMEPYAFGEIIPQTGNVPRLSRILVGQEINRGKGLGQLFVRELIQECIKNYDCKSVELFVWNQNDAAIQCYKNVGFEYLPQKQMTMIHENKRYDIYKMTYKIKGL